MNIFLSHGRRSRPDSPNMSKLSAISTAHGHHAESIDYTDLDDGDPRAERLTAIVESQTEPFCLVGASMGGYASMIAATAANLELLKGIFLIAPALYLPRYGRQEIATNLPNIEIIHGWHDDVVIYEHSIRYARQAQCTLHLVDDNHRFTKNPAILGEYFTRFLANIDKPS